MVKAFEKRHGEDFLADGPGGDIYNDNQTLRIFISQVLGWEDIPHNTYELVDVIEAQVSNTFREDKFYPVFFEGINTFLLDKELQSLIDSWDET